VIGSYHNHTERGVQPPITPRARVDGLFWQSVALSGSKKNHVEQCGHGLGSNRSASTSDLGGCVKCAATFFVAHVARVSECCHVVSYGIPLLCNVRHMMIQKK